MELILLIVAFCFEYIIFFCACMAAVGIFYVACRLVIVVIDAIEQAKERR